MIRKTLVLAPLVLALAVSAVSAEGWLWNPFAAKKPQQTTPKFVTPQQLPKTKNPPSTWDKMTTGTKNFFDWLNPFDGKPTTTKTSSNTAPKNSFISSSSRPLDDKPKSVPEFLSLPRPGEK